MSVPEKVSDTLEAYGETVIPAVADKVTAKS